MRAWWICFPLTFVQYFKADVGAAVIRGEQQIKEVAAAEQELGHLGAIEGANQRREEVRSVVDLEEVVTQLCLEPDRRKCSFPVIMVSTLIKQAFKILKNELILFLYPHTHLMAI